MITLPEDLKIDNESIEVDFTCIGCMTNFKEKQIIKDNVGHQCWDFNCPTCKTLLNVKRIVERNIYYKVDAPELENRFLEVDEFLDDLIIPSKKNVGVRYAQFVLEFMRAPAAKQCSQNEFTKQFKLFCTYRDQLRYRITGASRMGDVWLARDENKDTGYDVRVCIKDCSEFGPEWGFYYNEQGELTGYSVEKLEELKYGRRD